MLKVKVADEQHYTLFPCRPKMHKFQCGILVKIAEGSRVNPRILSCFGDESFVGPIANISRHTRQLQSGAQTIVRWQLLTLSRWNMLWGLVSYGSFHFAIVFASPCFVLLVLLRANLVDADVCSCSCLFVLISCKSQW